MINYEKTYFSPRLSNERLRVAKQVKDKEHVLVMFSGAAPYPCVIAKNAKPERIVGIELNPKAHELALENIHINKLKNVEVIEGDVLEVTPLLNETFDRIIMPLPKESVDFLESALLASKKGTIIHLYTFAHENEFDDSAKRLIEKCNSLGAKVKLIEVIPCGQHSPRVFRVCIDIKVIKP